MRLKKLTALFLTFFMVFSLCSSFTVVSYAFDNSLLQQINNMYNLRNSGNYKECIDVADQLLSQDNTLMDAYYNQSISYFSLNKYKEAFDVLKKQLELNPRNEIALYNAACASAFLGNKDQANGYLKELLTMNISFKNNIRKDNDLVPALKETKEFQKLTGISVMVGGELLDLDVPATVIEGRTMLPMRSIFEALGASISWDDATSSVKAEKNGVSISLSIGNKIALINGTEKEMDVSPILSNDRTLVPVRFISEALGAKVSWDSDNEVVTILTNPKNGSVNSYSDIKKELDDLMVVSVIDGAFPEPYNLKKTEGMALIIAKDKKALDLMNSMDQASRIKYMYETTYDNYALVVGCEPVHMKFVYDGKVYYAGDMYYDKKGEGIELTYYEKGLPINVVKQLKNKINYKDFYKLPAGEQKTSSIQD